MKRMMGPVLVVVGVLVAGANATRLVSFGQWLAAGLPGAMSRLSTGVAARLGGGADAAHAGIALAMGLGALALILAARGAWLVAEPRGPRRRVLAMARRGRPPAAIARRTRLSQDAVRTLLRPGREGTRLHA
jgi:hypothetical protein